MISAIKSSVPKWVKTLLRRIQFKYYWPHVKFIVNSKSDIAKIHAAGFYSQVGQDWYIKKIFDKLQIANGFFVDIGCNDPFNINNTIYFERSGWQGLAIDPLSLAARWSQRTAEFIQVALGENDAWVELEVPHEESNSENSNMFAAIKTGRDKFRCKQMDRIAVRQTTLDQLLTEREIKKIEFISIDVEGYEEHVLQGIDLNKFDVGVLAIENDFPSYFGRDSLRHLLSSKGYIFLARLHPHDDIFVSNKFASRLSARKRGEIF